MFGPASIAVVGAFRSGTNYVQFLLEQNFRCRCRRNFHGWKHAPIPIRRRPALRLLDAGVPIVAVYKHPLDFLPSLFRYRVAVDRNITAPRQWDAFLRERFTIHDGRKGRTPVLSFPDPVEYWNALYLNLLELPKPAFRRHFVSYGAVHANPEAEVTALAGRLGLKARKSDFILPEGKLARGKSGWRPAFVGNAALIVDKTKPGDAETPKVKEPEFTPQQRSFVMSRISPRLLEHFGEKLEARVA